MLFSLGLENIVSLKFVSDTTDNKEQELAAKANDTKTPSVEETRILSES